MKNKGFSLVELIVVIAIMAILVGVAVPVYSSYIEKTQKAKDQQLVDEVAHALQVYAAGNYQDAADDYVILTVDGASALEGGFAEAAMKATFGENWKDDLALEYDNWTDNGVLAQVLANASAAKDVAGSSYVQHSTPAEMLATVSTVTNALGNMAVTAGRDPLTTMKDFDLITDTQFTNIQKELSDNKLVWGEGVDNVAYGTALSNILVKELSKEAGAYDINGESAPSTLLGFASMYASLYGWASTSEEGAAELEELNNKITDPNATTQTIMSAFETFQKENFAENSGFMNYYSGNAGETDTKAFLAIMSSVSELSEDYDMLTAGVYTSDVVAQQLNDYINTVVAVSSMAENQAQIDALKSLEDGSVVVFVTAQGTVSVIPASVVESN